ncbi:LOG family protein [Patescibacteria group bacterium]
MTEEDKYQEHDFIKNVAFFGDANSSDDDPVYKSAYALGKLLAKNGFTIVNGGGPGVMNASTQGAVAGGGKTLSVTFDPVNAPGYEGKYVKNITDQEIKTTNYIERMFGLLEHADAFIIFKGGSGTMSEWGTAWVLAKLYFGHHKPFILFGNHWRPIVDAVKSNMNIDAQEMSVFEIVDKMEDVFPTLHKFEKKMQDHDHTKDCTVCVDSAFTK